MNPRVWSVGTGTLAGVILGGLVGFLLDQPPVFIAVGLAIGGLFDSWMAGET